MRILLGALALALAAPVVGTPAQADSTRHLDWREQVVDAGQSFRGLDAVNRRTAWVSGGNVTEGGPGKVFRTTDGGRTWDDVSPPGSEGLLFRDVEARSADVALVLAIGAGEASRIYRTTDGGATWTETFRNQDEAAFYNCMDFYPDGRRGLAVSDPVDGKFRILSTDDGGRSWEVLPDDGMPDSTGEANFAASGDCLVIKGRHAWFGSGGAAARIFHSADRGHTWTATDSTIPSGEAAGVLGLAFRDPRHGIAVGGDFAAADVAEDASAYTRNGRSWHNGGDLDVLAEDAAWLPIRRGKLVVSTGESGPVAGSHVSWDGGRSWKPFSDTGYHTLDCTADLSCWAAGGGGRVGRFGL
ncbi:MAG TPA: oxidoreductase [Nocardioides sp.]|nr:oxidoreductase [Nocardioides sp.]